MYCTHCGKELKDAAKSCPYCSGALDTIMYQSGDDLNKCADEYERSDNEIISDDKQNESAQYADASDAESSDGSPELNIIHPLVQDFGVKFKKSIFACCAVALIAIALVVILTAAKAPHRVKETGTYALTLGQTMTFQSVNTTVEFYSVDTESPNYDDLTAGIYYYLKVSFPKTRNVSQYYNWLNDFTINGISVSYDVGKIIMGSYMPLDISTIKQTDTLIFRITYTAQSTDSELRLSCKIKDDLEIILDPESGFWSLPGVDKKTAVAHQQEIIDEEYGLTLIDWTDSDTNTNDYSFGQTYAIKGTVSSVGAEDLSLGKRGVGRIIMCPPGNDLSDLFSSIICYFDDPQIWESRPEINDGDVITVYGTYYGEWFGPYYENCTFNSPAGQFTINDNGIVEIQNKPEVISSPDIETAEKPQYEKIMPDPLSCYHCDAYMLIGELGAGNFAYGDWVYITDFWASGQNADNCSATMYCCNYNIMAPDIPVHVEFASADEFNNAIYRSEPCDICGLLEEKNGAVYLKNAVFCEEPVENNDKNSGTLNESGSSGETSSELSTRNSIVYTMQNICSAQDVILVYSDTSHEQMSSTLNWQLTNVGRNSSCAVMNSEEIPYAAAFSTAGDYFVILSSDNVCSQFVQGVQNNGYTVSLLGSENGCCWGFIS